MSQNQHKYHCGPQSWPRWIRKPISKYYNRACRNHDENYNNNVDFKKSESQFKSEVSRRRGVLKKAWKFGKVSFLTYLVHGRLLGLFMPRLTRRFGKHFRK